MKEKEIFDLDLDDLSSPVARLTHTWCPCTPGEIGVCRLELWGQKGMNFTINGLKSLKRLNELQEDWSYLLKTFKPIVKFKLKMAHEESPEKTWIERYTEEDLKKWHCKTPEELGNVLISFFNGSLKRGEKARIFKGVEEKE